MNLENDISEDTIFNMLRNRVVKDLYWLLFSECPIKNNQRELNQIPFFPEEILEKWRKESDSYFFELDQQSQDLENFLHRPKNKRLGFYSEALLSFFFQTFPGIELLLQNYQIIEDKRTLGEVDFIIKWQDRIIHIECAVKFYLCDHSKDVQDLHSWIGPACKDDLGRKMKKVIEHQLPIIESSSFRDFFDYSNIESFIFLKGKLFVNQEVQCDWVKKSLLGQYLYLKEFKNSSELHLLSKPNWLSIHNEKDLNDATETLTDNSLLKKAELVMSSGRNPFFIVPEDWPFSDS